MRVQKNGREKYIKKKELNKKKDMEFKRENKLGKKREIELRIENEIIQKRSEKKERKHINK